MSNEVIWTGYIFPWQVFILCSCACHMKFFSWDAQYSLISTLTQREKIQKKANSCPCHRERRENKSSLPCSFVCSIDGLMGT